MAGQIRVYIASSLDGFIAGEGDDLSWLPPPNPDGDDFGFGEFMSEIGALLIGRRTYEVAAGFPDDQWAYGDRPVLVATHRPIAAARSSIHVRSGTIEDMVASAKEAAGDKDVYLDGGQLIRQALDAGVVDELTVTLVPFILGSGVPLFAGASRRHPLDLVSHIGFKGGLMQLCYRPRAAH